MIQGENISISNELEYETKRLVVSFSDWEPKPRTQELLILKETLFRKEFHQQFSF